MRCIHSFSRVAALRLAAIGLAVALPFNANASDPTPDPPEPYAVGGPEVIAVSPAISTAEATLVQSG
jgi:hypothetical protein